MHRATEARNEIGPLLDRLITQLESEGSATQSAYFNRIRRTLCAVNNDLELTTPIVELSTAPVVGFRFSHDADALIDRILVKVAQLAQELETITPVTPDYQ
ncbi:MAG: hypothetical protein O3A63_00780 [Proteobacteria bacterium]|nr:hypothetical protein [Pseudomonadota bacterium]